MGGPESVDPDSETDAAGTGLVGAGVVDVVALGAGTVGENCAGVACAGVVGNGSLCLDFPLADEGLRVVVSGSLKGGLDSALSTIALDS